MAGKTSGGILCLPCKLYPRHRLTTVTFRTMSTLCQLSWTLLMILALLTCGKCNDGDYKQTFSIPEEQDVHTYVGRIGEDLDNAAAPYLIIADDEVKRLFELNESNGDIRTKSRIDREAKLNQDGKVIDNFKFVAISKSSGKSIEIEIKITDINDHSPVFRNSEETFDILETMSSQSKKYPLGSVVDNDEGDNAVQSYRIVSGNTNDVFQLGSRVAPNGLVYMDLEIVGNLDHEAVSHYRLEIHAYDGGSPPKHGTMFVTVNVLDANDNQPIFSQSQYHARVPENATVGTSILQVSATDRDSGENGRIEYEIDRTKSDQDNHFGIDSSNGKISVMQNLDYETKKSYELIVIARDNGTQSLQTTCVVSVQVDNINDNPPTISFVFIQDGGIIPETEDPGSYVARISVTDPDQKGEEDIADIDVTITGGEGKFSLDPQEDNAYLVLLDETLDREEVSSYELVITASDRGNPPLQSQKVETILVGDVNDNPPRFLQNTFYADIQEVVPAGSSVIQLTAEDADIGNNSIVHYKILNTPDTHSDWFEINKLTGLITTKTSVDCETESKPELSVVASNPDVLSYTAEALVIVNIRDVNDNQPIFDQSFYNVTIPEDTAVGRCILKKPTIL